MFEFIEQGFLTILNMSITGSYMIAAVILLRLILQKAPKKFSYFLWSIPALRLIFPFSFSSVLSIFNLFDVPSESTAVNRISAFDYVPENIGMMSQPKITTGIASADSAINAVLPAAEPTASINPMQILISVASVLWLAGIAAMTVYCVVSFIRIHKQTEFATKIKENIFECETIASPFVFGIIRPKIFLPYNVNEKSREYITLHEQTHIKRFDYITKIFAYIILSLHWFNPLVWLAFRLMTRDMEMSCDEKVLSSLGEHDKKDYGLTLVAVGSSKRFASAAPLSFGENGVEERVVNILKFKKPTLIAVSLCFVLCIAAGIVCLTNATDGNDKYAEQEEKIEAFFESRNDTIAAVEIVEMKDNNTAYCWMQMRSFDYSYAKWLDGTEEAETEKLSQMVDELFSKEEPLVSEPDAAPIMIKAKFNDSFVVTDVESIFDDPPVDMGSKTEYAETLWKQVVEKSKEKHKNAYGGKYRLENVYFSSNSDEVYRNLYPISYELVEYMNKPVFVVKMTNTMQTYNTLQIPYYRIDGNFSMRVLDGSNESKVKNLERDPDKSYNTPMYSIAGGAESGKEYLCIYDLSPFVTTLYKDYKYFIDLKIETPFGHQADASIQFQISSESLSDSTPELTYETLVSGSKADITEKISSPVYGWISKGYNNPKSFALSEEQTKEIVQKFNSAILTADNSSDPINFDEIFCVQITDKSQKIHSFCVNLEWILDHENNKYQSHNAELFKTVADIYENILKTEAESTTATAVFSEDIPQITKPNISKHDEKSYQDIVPIYTGIYPQTTVKTIEQEVIGSSNEPKLKYVVTDIKTSETAFFELLGIEIRNSYEGYYFCLTMINPSPAECYISKNYLLEKHNDGLWIACPRIAEFEGGDPIQLYSNNLMYIPLTVKNYLKSPENGRYRITLPVNANGNAGNFSVEFTVTKYMSSKLSAGTKIENPISVTVYPGTSGVAYCYNILSDETINEIIGYCNSFNPYPIEKQPSQSHYSVSIIDKSGDEYFFIIHNNGTVAVNGKYYKTESGDKLYRLLSNLN